jgi:hypothetical protein
VTRQAPHDAATPLRGTNVAAHDALIVGAWAVVGGMPHVMGIYVCARVVVCDNPVQQGQVGYPARTGYAMNVT